MDFRWFALPLGCGVGLGAVREGVGFSRLNGRWEAWFPVPFAGACILSIRRKTNLQMVDAPKYLKDVNWIIDEFDSSFNDLAVASLRWHLTQGRYIVQPGDRAKYQDIIDRLTEPEPEFTDDELAVLGDFRDDFEPAGDGYSRFNPSQEKRGIYDAYKVREDAYLERIRQARHDFIDILPGLWS